MDLKLLLAITLNFVEINGARREGRISSRSKSSLCHGSNVNRRIEQRPHQRQFSQRFRALQNLRSFCTELAFHIFRYSVIGGKTQVTNQRGSVTINVNQNIAVCMLSIRFYKRVPFVNLKINRMFLWLVLVVCFHVSLCKIDGEHTRKKTNIHILNKKESATNRLHWITNNTQR